MTKDQALALAAARLRMQKPPVDRAAIDADMKRMADPTAGMGGMEKFNAGMGKAFTDIGRGAAQLVGMGPSAEEVRETRQLDAPLMKSGAGMAGNVAGNIAAFAPLAVIPGGATVGGAGALGMTAGALQPTESVTEKLTNQGLGLALGAGTQYLGTTGARKIGEIAAGREAAAKALQSKNAVRDQTLREGQALGLRVPPSAVNPSVTNDVLESIAGKAAMNQQAAKLNQPIVDDVLRAEASLSPAQALSTQALKDSRKTLAGPYRELTSISPQAAADMEALKAARLESKLNWQEYSRNQTAAAYKEAVRQDQIADGLEKALERHAATIGRNDLVPSMRDARVKIAKNHTVDRAVNVGTGYGDPAVLGAMLDRGVPLSGDLKKVAAFQQAFKQPMREASTVPNPGSSNLASVLSGALGAGGFAAGGVPGIAAAAIPFAAPSAARSLQLARGLTVKPDYSVGATTKAAAALNDPATREKVALLLRALALPTVPQAVNQ